MSYTLRLLMIVYLLGIISLSIWVPWVGGPAAAHFACGYGWLWNQGHVFLGKNEYMPYGVDYVRLAISYIIWSCTTGIAYLWFVAKPKNKED